MKHAEIEYIIITIHFETFIGNIQIVTKLPGEIQYYLPLKENFCRNHLLTSYLQVKELLK